MDRRNLTQRQSDTLEAIREYRKRTGMSPTLQELADAIGTQKVTVFEYLNELQRKGYITRDKFKSRSIKVVEDSTDGVLRTAIAELKQIASASKDRPRIAAVIRSLETAVQ